MRNFFRTAVRKVTVTVVGVLLLTLLMPLLSYAMMGAFQFYISSSYIITCEVYNNCEYVEDPNGEKVPHLAGYVYTKDPSSVKVVTKVTKDGVETTSTVSNITYSKTYKSGNFDDDNNQIYHVRYDIPYIDKPESILLSDSSASFTLSPIEQNGWSDYRSPVDYDNYGPYRMAAAEFLSNYPAGSFLQPSARIASFTPTQSDSNAITFFLPGGEDPIFTYNYNQMIPSDFTLFDETTSSYSAISSLDAQLIYDHDLEQFVPSDHDMIFRTATNLIAGHSYILRMSPTSSGAEMKLAKAGYYFNVVLYVGTELNEQTSHFFYQKNAFFFDRIVLEAAQTGTVTGTVVDNSLTQAFSGVAVIMKDNAGIVIGTEITDSLGNYTFKDVPVGDFHLDFIKAGYLPWSGFEATVTSGTTTQVPVHVMLKSIVYGVVSSSSETDIIGAIATLTDINEQFITSGNGIFNFIDLPVGSHNLTISKEGYKTYSTTFSISNGQELNLGNIYLIALDTSAPTPPPKEVIVVDPSAAGSNSNSNPPPALPTGPTSTPTVAPIPTRTPDVFTSDSNGGTKLTPVGLKEKSAMGQEVLTVTLDPGTFNQALDQLKDKSKDQQILTIDTGQSQTDIANISLPTSLIATSTAASHEDVVLKIISNDTTYNLPLKLLDLASLTKALGSDASKANVTITIEKISGAAGDKINAGAKAAGFEAIGNAIDFTITIEANGVKKEINDFGSTYVSRTITIPQDITANQASAVLYDPATGGFSFVPATFSTVDGKTTITIKRNGNSQYVIVSSSKSFTDTQKMYATDDINLLASKLIVNGITATEFKPYDKITRAQFTALLVRALGLTVDTSASTFTDIKAGDWYANSITTAVKAGLIKGFEDGSFHPNDSITREQMASLISKALSVTGKSVDVEGKTDQIISKFTDKAKVSAWASADTAKVTEAGIMQGDAGKFAPKAFADRAQAVVTLKRLLVFLDFIN